MKQVCFLVTNSKYAGCFRYEKTRKGFSEILCTHHVSIVLCIKYRSLTKLHNC